MNDNTFWLQNFS